MRDDQEKRNEELIEEIKRLTMNPSEAVAQEGRVVVMTLTLPKLCWLIVEGEANSQGISESELLAEILHRQVIVAQFMATTLMGFDGG